jgi:hypothetical protein
LVELNDPRNPRIPFYMYNSIFNHFRLTAVMLFPVIVKGVRSRRASQVIWKWSIVWKPSKFLPRIDWIKCKDCSNVPFLGWGRHVWRKEEQQLRFKSFIFKIVSSFQYLRSHNNVFIWKVMAWSLWDDFYPPGPWTCEGVKKESFHIRIYAI